MDDSVQVIDSCVRSSFRKKLGLMMVVLISNGLIGDIQIDNLRSLVWLTPFSTVLVLRLVATIAFPEARADLTKSTPIAQLVPVINRTFLSVIVTPSCFSLSSRELLNSTIVYYSLFQSYLVREKNACDVSTKAQKPLLQHDIACLQIVVSFF
jgi:hypothetical protein